MYIKKHSWHFLKTDIFGTFLKHHFIDGVFYKYFVFFRNRKCSYPVAIILLERYSIKHQRKKICWSVFVGALEGLFTKPSLFSSNSRGKQWWKAAIIAIWVIRSLGALKGFSSLKFFESWVGFFLLWKIILTPSLAI